MFNSPIAILFCFVALLTAAYFTFKSFVKYEFEGIKGDTLPIFIFSIASFLGAFVMLGMLFRLIH